MTEERRFYRASEIADMLYPDFTEDQLKWWLRERNKNGLDTCVIKIGKILRIDLDRFSIWLESRFSDYGSGINK
jgi:hypothetical protein